MCGCAATFFFWMNQKKITIEYGYNKLFVNSTNILTGGLQRKSFIVHGGIPSLRQKLGRVDLLQ